MKNSIGDFLNKSPKILHDPVSLQVFELAAFVDCTVSVFVPMTS
jgi:hypothetical protein